jgi:transposase
VRGGVGNGSAYSESDAADAQAICEAVQRPKMRFVPVKGEAQQAQLMVHRARQGFVKERTATLNRIRGLLAEFGHILAAKAETVRRQAALLLEQLPGRSNRVIGDLLSQIHHLDQRIAEYDGLVKSTLTPFIPAATYNRLRGLISEFGIVLPQKVACLRREIGAHLEELPGYANQCIGDLLAHADGLDLRIDEYDRIIVKAARDDARSKRLMERPGIGPISASALLASIGGGHDFKNGRQVAAWMGLTPGQYSSGGKARLGRITKAGDPYLRSLLVMGARAVLAGLGDKQDGFSRWARTLQERRGYWRTGIAIAAKNARLAWAVLRYGEEFRLKPSAS